MNDPIANRFVAVLRPLLEANCALSAWVVGSRARNTARPESDIDVIVVAPSRRPFVDRFRDYLPALIEAEAGVDLLIYTPEEFDQMQRDERPFLANALRGALQIHSGADVG